MPRPTSPARKAAAVTAAASLAISLIAAFEGKRNDAYIPVPGDVPTICYGSTAGVVLGMRKTDAECRALLYQEANQYGLGIQHCIKVEVPREPLAAFISFSYNVGTYAFCSSTAAKKLNAGDLAGACAELDRWVYGPHKKRLRGLVVRRAEERRICEQGLVRA